MKTVRGITLGALLSIVGFWLPVVACVTYAQEKPAPVTTLTSAKPTPTLTEVQKLQIQNALLRLELAQRDFDKVRVEAQTLIMGLQVPGYDLDLQLSTYKPKPVEPVKK